MERLLPVLLIVLIVIAFPTLVQAEDQPAPGDPGYKPLESRADDGGMAAIVALVFGFPVVVWLIVRTLKKSAGSRGSAG